jgi:type I restriction enzyme S subunit
LNHPTGRLASADSWFRDLPDDWRVLPVRTALTEKTHKNDGQARDAYLSLVSGVGVIPYEEKGDLGNKKSDDLSKCKLVEVGDFVINSMNFLIGGFGRSRYQGVCSSVYVVATPNEQRFDPRFLMRVFQVSEFQRHVGRLGKGIMALRMAIGWDELKGQSIPAPPLPDQVRIANFLDEQTARIDALIAEKEELRTPIGCSGVF